MQVKNWWHIAENLQQQDMMAKSILAEILKVLKMSLLMNTKHPKSSHPPRGEGLYLAGTGGEIDFVSCQGYYPAHSAWRYLTFAKRFFFVLPFYHLYLFFYGLYLFLKKPSFLSRYFSAAFSSYVVHCPACHAACIKICTEKSEISQNSHNSYVIFLLCTTALSALSPSKVQ